jgi:hypothetical protein
MRHFRSFFVFFTVLLVCFTLTPSKTFAIEDPLSVPNNKFGIHILFDTELESAAKLVNANEGEWGYVVLPLQAGDRDLAKWQKFMDECTRLRLIPLVRLASEGDYFNTKVWRKPNAFDVIDFSNFLNSLDWPTKNRYVIVFNEVNRGDEWGGTPNPKEYAELLSYAVSVFKSRNEDFFVISAGLDNAAPNRYGEFMNQYDYIRAMDRAVPGIFNQVDGLSSHSYPNPSFAQPPSVLTKMSIASFRYEQQLAESLSVKKLPVFITETGWSEDFVSDATIAAYYKQAFETVWNDPSIVAIAPFLLHAGGGPFKQFSFLKEDGSQKEQYKAFSTLSRVKGQPVLPLTILSAHAEQEQQPAPTRNFAENPTKKRNSFSLAQAVQSTFRFMFNL